MMKKKIKQDSSYLSVFEPTVTLKDKMSVLSALNKKYISGTSPIIREFENRLENQFSSNKAVINFHPHPLDFEVPAISDVEVLEFYMDILLFA